jgi:O-antigen ligase
LYRTLTTATPSGQIWYRLRSKVWLPSAVLIGLIVLVVNVPRFYTEPIARMQDALNDVRVLSTASATGQPPAAAIATSVGVRLYMWQMAMAEIKKSPVVGHSRAKRIEWIQGLGKVSGADAFGGLAHLHSDPLNAWFDHGLPGLLSYLGLAFGLAWVAWRHAHPGSALRFGLTGLFFMHVSAGLTNMNTGHNYYGVVLSLSIALTYLLSRPGGDLSGPSAKQG